MFNSTTVPNIGTAVLASTPRTTGSIYVPTDALETYKSNSKLSTYANNIYPVDDTTTLSFASSDVKSKLVQYYDMTDDGNIQVFEANGVSILSKALFSDSSTMPNFAFDEFELFSNCSTMDGDCFKNSNITSIKLPASMRTLRASNFYGCTKLISLTGIPEGVTLIPDRFLQNCRLTSLRIPSTVTAINSYAFEYNLFTYLTIPEACRSIGASSLGRQYQLRALIVKADLVGGVGCTYAGGWVGFGLNGGTRIYVPAAALTWYQNAASWSLTSPNIKGMLRAIGDIYITYAGDLIYHVADDKLTMTSLKVSGFINGDDILVLRDMMINGNLANLDLSDASIVGGGAAYYGTDTTTASVIGNNMFRDCVKLVNLTLPTSVTTLGVNSLSGCTSIVAITIPSNISVIGNNAFSGCTLLNDVTLTKTLPPTAGTGVFDGCAALNYIYVPSASVAAYKGATNWSFYTGKITAI